MSKETTATRRIRAARREGRTYALPRTDEPRGCLCGCVPSWMKPPRVEKKTRSVDGQNNHASAVQDATCTGISDVGQPEESRSGVKERTLTDLIGVRFVGDSLCDSGFGLSDDQASQATTLSNASVEESGDGVRERALTDAIPSGRPARDSDFGLSDAQVTRAATLAEAAPEESRGTFFRSMTASSEIGRLSFDSDFGLSDGQLITCTGVTDVVQELSHPPEPNANGDVVDVPEMTESKGMFTMANLDVTVEALNDVPSLDEFLWKDTNGQQKPDASGGRHHYDHVDGILLDQEVGTPSTHKSHNPAKLPIDDLLAKFGGRERVSVMYSALCKKYGVDPSQNEPTSKMEEQLPRLLASNPYGAKPTKSQWSATACEDPRYWSRAHDKMLGM